MSAIASPKESKADFVKRNIIAADMAEIELQRSIEMLRKLRGKEHTRRIIEAEMDA